MAGAEGEPCSLAKTKDERRAGGWGGGTTLAGGTEEGSSLRSSRGQRSSGLVAAELERAPEGSEWDAAETSVVSKWALNCDGGGPALVSLPASLFFAGHLAGGFLLTTLANTHLGRRKMLVLLRVLVSLSDARPALSVGE